MGYDKRWHDIAEQWIYDSEISVNRKHVEALIPKLAQQLQDVAEQFVSDTQHDMERAELAAEDAYWHRRIDEALGK